MWSYATSTKNNRLDVVTSDIGIGGKLQIYTAGYVTKLLEYAWTGNVFAGAVGGVIVMLPPAINPVVPLANGNAAVARFTQSDGSTVIIQDMTVGTVATDVVLTNTAIVTTAPETLLSVTITHA